MAAGFGWVGLVASGALVFSSLGAGTVGVFEGPDLLESGVLEDPEVVDPYMSQDPPTGGEPLEPRSVEPVEAPEVEWVPGEELIGEREASSKTFMGDEPGLFETELFTAPVHFENSPGEWVEFDTSLQQDGQGRWVPAATGVGVSIAGDSADEQVVLVELGEGRSVGWGVAIDDEGLVGPEPVEVEVEGEVATFEQVVPDVSVQVSATGGGAKEDLVLDSADVPTSYEFPLTLTGVDAQAVGGGVRFVDDQGVVVGAVPAGFMEDGAGVVSDGVSMDLTEGGDGGDGGDGVVLVVSVDAEWLGAPERVFPVRVDPTVNLNSSIVDTFVQSDSPDTDFSGYSLMRVGQVSAGGAVARGLVKFNLESLMHKSIVEAELSLFNNYSATCQDHAVTLYRATSAWEASTVGWPGPTSVSTIGSRVTESHGGPGCSADWIDFDMAKPVRDVVNRDRTNHGFVIEADEDNPDAFKRFATSEAPDLAHRPVMRVVWSEPLLGNLGFYTMNTQALSDVTQLQVNVASRNVLVHGADVGLPGVAGTDLGVNRYYNSRADADVETAGMTGLGWSMDVGQDVRLAIDPYSRTGFFTGPSGYQVTFPYRTGSVQAYEQPVGLNASLVDNDPQDADSVDYTVTFHDSGLAYHFRDGEALSEIEDTSGNTITMNYDSAGLLSSITDTKDRDTTFTYNTQDRVTKVTDPFGRAVDYTYDAHQRLMSVADAEGAVTTYGYNGLHHLVSITDPEGNTTNLGYEISSRGASPVLEEITWADSTPAVPVITTYERWGSTPGVDMVDPNGNEWAYRFDTKGRLDEFHSPRSGEGEEYEYDAFNSVTDYTTNAGGTGTFTYDGYNVVDFTTDTGATTKFEYNGPVATRPSSRTDPQGNTLLYSWVNEQQLEEVSDGDDDAVLAQMDYRGGNQSCAGELASSTDGNGNTTTYAYDSDCNLTQISRPGPAGNTTMTYDSLDRIVTITDGDGRRQTLSYDDNDRVTRVDYTRVGEAGLTDRVDYVYDDNGNTTSRGENRAGRVQTSTYVLDARNRLTSETLPDPATSSGTYTNTYGYDPAGNLAVLTSPWGATAYTYDVENAVASIIPPVGDPIDFDYNEHTYAAVKYPNNVTDAQHYDTSGRIERIEQYRSNGGPTTWFAQREHSYNDPDTDEDTNSLSGITDTKYELEWSYTYDSQGRIATSHGASDADPNPFEDNTYTYDANSNRTAWSRYGNDYTASFNDSNQMTSTTGPSGSTTYTYDGAGNLTAGTDGTDISYDVRGHATSLQRRGGPALEATYAGASQVERTSAGNTTFTQSILGVNSSADPGYGTRHYVRAPDGRVIAEYRQDAPVGDRWRYYLTNHQGSITGATNEAGTRTESYGYGPYGEYQYGSGGGTDLIHWRYTGQWQDGTSVAGNGYTKIGLRYLDTTHGRWTQPDPLIRATNPNQPAEATPYTYAGCNPVNQTDPTGACSKTAEGAFWLMGAGGLVLAAPATLGATSLYAAGAAAFGLNLGLGSALGGAVCFFTD